MVDDGARSDGLLPGPVPESPLGTAIRCPSCDSRFTVDESCNIELTVAFETVTSSHPTDPNAAVSHAVPRNAWHVTCPGCSRPLVADECEDLDNDDDLGDLQL